jgi:hypothetical protein
MNQTPTTRIITGTIIAFSAVVLAACGNTDVEPKPNEVKSDVIETENNAANEPATSAEAPLTTTSAADETAQSEVGPAIVGASYDSFTNEYGKPNMDDDIMKNFDDNRLLCIGANNCMVLTIAFGDGSGISLDEALLAVKQMLPADAVETNRSEKIESDIDLTTTYVEYMSEETAGKFDASEFIGSEPGSILAIVKANENGVFSAILTLGNNP